MTTNKLQEAIAQIESGNKAGGFQLLTEVLKAEPRNEMAWLWMSTLAAGDKKRYCLEKVLSINPNNMEAKQQLAQLLPSQSPASQAPAMQPVTLAPQNQPVPVNVEPALMSHPAVAQVASNAQVWLIPGKQLATIIYLSKDILLAFDLLPNLASNVAGEIKQGMTPQALYNERSKYHLQNICYVTLEKITTVRLFGEQLRVTAIEDSGAEKKYNVTCNKENTEAVLKALQQALGPRFQRITRPISRSTVATSGVILFLMVACGTGFFYWFAQGLANEGSVAGSSRARGLAHLILLIGPNGFLCIGGVLFLIVIIAMISSSAKPPEETVLTRDLESK